MVRRWQRRRQRERERERPVRRVRAGTEAAGRETPRSSWSRVPALGPYEFRYEVSHGYQDERVVDVR